MKESSIILISILLLSIHSCRMPADPLGEVKIIKRLETINTGGDCLDLDVDINDSVMVAAANYNGYFIYKIITSGGLISGTNDPIHISADEMDSNLGDNRAQFIILSKEHNIAFHHNTSLLIPTL